MVEIGWPFRLRTRIGSANIATFDVASATPVIPIVHLEGIWNK
jgi:hypothetical protein